MNSAQSAVDLAKEISNAGQGLAVAIKGDVSTPKGGQDLIDATLKAFGKIDILVLNAGIMGDKPLANIDEEYFDSHFDTNVKGPLFMVKAAVPHLPSRRSFPTTLVRTF
jgi:3-oxoacyl-[acyl-carrier protein] reductase